MNKFVLLFGLIIPISNCAKRLVIDETTSKPIKENPYKVLAHKIKTSFANYAENVKDFSDEKLSEEAENLKEASKAISEVSEEEIETELQSQNYEKLQVYLKAKEKLEEGYKQAGIKDPETTAVAGGFVMLASGVTAAVTGYHYKNKKINLDVKGKLILGGAAIGAIAGGVVIALSVVEALKRRKKEEDLIKAYQMHLSHTISPTKKLLDELAEYDKELMQLISTK